MKFCDNCGSYLKQTREGYWCPRCHKLVASTSNEKRAKAEKKSQEAVHIFDKNQEQHAKAYQTCPRCANKEAYHWVSSTSGEHAGVRQERTVEHFKCTKCSHTWNKSS